MCYIFRNNETTKVAFRSGGGFIWTVSVLDGIGRCMEGPTFDPEGSTSEPPTYSIKPESELELFNFLKALIHTLSIVLTGNAANQTYFREDIHFSTLSETLQACHFIEGQSAVQLSDSLLNMAVKGTWPPSCPKHEPAIQLLPPWESAGEPLGPLESKDSISITQSRALVGSCSQCREALFIENPEIFRLIVQLIGKTSKKPASDAHVNHYTYILNVLTYLADVTQFNQQKLSSIGLTGDILACFQSELMISNRFAKNSLTTSLQSHLLALIHKVSCFHISLEELRRYLLLMRRPEFPLSLLEAFVETTKRDVCPSYYADFSKK